MQLRNLKALFVSFFIAQFKIDVKRAESSHSTYVTLESSLSQPLLARFTSRRHPNPKSKTTNSADYLFCQTTWKSATLFKWPHDAI